MIGDLLAQADYCKTVSPLYAALFETLAGFARAHADGQTDPALTGFFETLERCWEGRMFNAFFERPLLLAGAIHEQVLQGNAPELARHYPSCGGHFDARDQSGFAQALKATLAARHQAMVPFLRQPAIQTNETARGMVWLLPLLAHWHTAGQPPLTLIELGCSAGLGLIADQYGYQIRRPGMPDWHQPGAPSFALELHGPGAGQAGETLHAMPELRAAIRHRVGCDLNPIDCADATQRRRLEALIWPDNVPRLQRLRAAIKTQDQSALRLETGDMVDCVHRLSRDSGLEMPLICLFNTVATCYLDEDHYARLRQAVAQAFHGPWAARDCLWIEFELPRRGESLPDFAQGKEQLIRLHQGDGQGGLRTRYFGAAKAHPTAIEVF